MPKNRDHLPLVYSCSGCSSAAQMANYLALRLDREGIVEMSCIAGVGGGVGPLLRKLHAAAGVSRPIIGIDGCALACVRASLALRDVTPSLHIQLGEVGVRKVYQADFDPSQADELFQRICTEAKTLPGRTESIGSPDADA